MRNDFNNQLMTVNEDLVRMSELVAAAVANATKALLDCDLALAEDVIGGDDVVNALNIVVEDECFKIVALQAPVARDLRIVMDGVRMASSLERMGDLAVHIAQYARRAYPNPAVPEALSPTFVELGAAAEQIARRMGRVIVTRDPEEAAEIRKVDDTLDRIHLDLFKAVEDAAWPHGVKSAVDVSLLSRFYERFGDHAVSVARRIIHIATGEH